MDAFIEGNFIKLLFFFLSYEKVLIQALEGFPVFDET